MLHQTDATSQYLFRTHPTHQCAQYSVEICLKRERWGITSSENYSRVCGNPKPTSNSRHSSRLHYKRTEERPNTKSIVSIVRISEYAILQYRSHRLVYLMVFHLIVGLR